MWRAFPKDRRECERCPDALEPAIYNLNFLKKLV